MKTKTEVLALALVILMALLPCISGAQEKAAEIKLRPNAAPCYNYWSVGVFGGAMQFNGDLSKNHWINLGQNSMGYNVGLVATKQFTRVIGVRARIAYGMVQSRAENKFTWDYLDGNGTPAYISQSFKSTIVETDLQLTVNWVNWIMGYKPDRFFSSYLIAGFGMDQSRGTKYDIILDKNVASLGYENTEMNAGNTNGTGGRDLQYKLDAGIGFDFNLNKHFSIPVEFSWRWQNSDDLDMTRGGAQRVETDMYSSATVGITYKFGYHCPEPVLPLAIVVPPAVAPGPAARFSMIAPGNIPAERTVREIFPLRNYVFFDLGSTKIPNRYVLLRKGQVADFREDQFGEFPPATPAGRSERQMVVYYNIINILGDRMVKNPSATVRLTGASNDGTDDGRAMAESVKQYLVDIFSIDGSRIKTEGQIKPRNPSEQPGGTKELDLLREGDRRVSIWSTSPALLMEFQDGDDARLKPVEIIATQKAPLDSYVFFNVAGAKEAYSSWSLEVRDDQGTVQTFGPYTGESVNMPGKSILGTRTEGNYKVTLVGLDRNGNTVRKDTTVHMVLWTPPVNEEVRRYSVIFEFDESNLIPMYDKYLTEVVIPKIPAGGTVVIHGHTDDIGDADYNMKLSLARANDVKNIMASGLSKAGRSDVKFEVHGFGEDLELSPFENKFPEERFYNRTVIIDIMPVK